MRVCVSPDLCCGAQTCVEAAPEVYWLKDGFNGLVGADGPFTIAAGLEDKAREGAEACPESAIQILD
ncbi:ferredoxin [Sphingomonas immobilis]|uniref:Ferredoxin n=1 Tax=Sphingomonas immobilis TaxID=3063997 RepID=A0ABT8ZX41_9SPHN|nr:ferredoxin [Sphingomonas sp. CA1-15]MDO7842142.1 ferredoxin [Sphingomonas sp. CA1-15]